MKARKELPIDPARFRKVTKFGIKLETTVMRMMTRVLSVKILMFFLICESAVLLKKSSSSMISKVQRI